jgi:spartin
VRIGSWVYPLASQESPAMKTNFNAYIFPNEENNNETISGAQANNRCSFIGVAFADNIASEQRSLFEDVLTTYGSLIYQNIEQNKDQIQAKAREANVPPPPFNLAERERESRGIVPSAAASGMNSTLTSTNVPSMVTSSKVADSKSKLKSDKEISSDEDEAIADKDKSNLKPSTTAERIAQQMIVGAQYLSGGVSSTADYASKYIQMGGEKLKSQLEPNAQQANINPTMQNAMQNVRYGTHLTVRVSSFLLNKLGTLASTTAKKVAPHIREGSTQLLSKSGIAGDKNSADSYVDGAFAIATSSLQGFSMVYDSLEQAAKTLGKNVANQTVTVVEHKYR